MKIKLIWDQIVDGVEHAAEEVIEVAENIGRLLIGQGGAVAADAAKAPAQTADEAPADTAEAAPAQTADEAPADTAEAAPAQTADEAPADTAEAAPAQTAKKPAK